MQCAAIGARLVSYAKNDERVGSRCSCRRSAGGDGETHSPTGVSFQLHSVSPDPTKTAATYEHRSERSEQSNTACASDASFKLRGASAGHPLQHLSGLRGDLVLAQHLVLRSDRLGH